MINAILWNSTYDCKNCIKNTDDKLCHPHYLWRPWNVSSRPRNVRLDIKIHPSHYEGKKKAPMMCTDLTWSTWKTLQFHHFKVHWEKTPPPSHIILLYTEIPSFFFFFLSIPDLICVESPTWTCWIPFKWKWKKSR